MSVSSEKLIYVNRMQSSATNHGVMCYPPTTPRWAEPPATLMFMNVSMEILQL